MSAAEVSTRSSSWMRPTRMCGRPCSVAARSAGAAPGAVSPGARSGCASVSTSVVQLVGRDAAIEGDALDAERLQPADQLAVVVPRLRGSGMSPTTISWPMMPIATDGWSASSCATTSASASSARADQRMAGRVELRAAQRRGKAADEVVGQPRRRPCVHHAGPPPAVRGAGARRALPWRRGARRRGPLVRPLSSARSRCGRAACAQGARRGGRAAARSGSGAHHSPR